MGLDVYLYRYEDKAKADEAEAAIERYGESLWAKRDYTAVPKPEREAIAVKTKAERDRLGFTDYYAPGVTKIENNSAKYPEHYFKVGYFRSSYNEGGIERVCERLLGVRPLADAFMPGERYEFQPDWRRAKRKIAASRRKLDAHVASDEGRYDVLTESHNLFTGVEKRTAVEALALFHEQRRRKAERPDPFDGMYSTQGGLFSMKEPLRVVALINGTNCLGSPCIHAVYEKDSGDMDYYVQALEIVEETIDYALGLSADERAKLWLHWSG